MSILSLRVLLQPLSLVSQLGFYYLINELPTIFIELCNCNQAKIRNFWTLYVSTFILILDLNGSYCDEEFHYCKNNATCVPEYNNITVNPFTCICTEGYIGDTCASKAILQCAYYWFL